MRIIVNFVINGWKGNVMTKTANSVMTDQKNPVSSFRMWVQNIWIQNCEEHLTYGEEPYKMREYWNKYKYWLKREYQHQRHK